MTLMLEKSRHTVIHCVPLCFWISIEALADVNSSEENSNIKMPDVIYAERQDMCRVLQTLRHSASAAVLPLL